MGWWLILHLGQQPLQCSVFPSCSDHVALSPKLLRLKIWPAPKQVMPCWRRKKHHSRHEVHSCLPHRDGSETAAECREKPRRFLNCNSRRRLYNCEVRLGDVGGNRRNRMTVPCMGQIVDCPAPICSFPGGCAAYVCVQLPNL